MGKTFASFVCVAAALVAIAGCSQGSNEQSLADNITKAAYNNDIAGVTQYFDTSLAPTVSRASLGVLSDQMHKLGNYKGLTETGTDLPARRYTFDAKFDRGDMTVFMRLDPDGKVAAYRVTAGAPQ